MHICVTTIGSGKSTFLWLRGEVERPAQCLDDATTENTEGRGASLDLVGTNLELDRVLRMIAVLLTKQMPDTFVLFSTRAKRDAAVLAQLGIHDFYICPIVPVVVHDCDDPLDLHHADTMRFYDNKMIELLQQAGFRVVTHHDPMPPLGGNRTAMETIFPDGTVNLPPWEEFTSHPSPTYVLRFNICEAIWRFKTVHHSNELNFLNAMIDPDQKW